MNTPTVIRHEARGNTILLVVTYFEGGQLSAAFQRYTVHPELGGRMVMEDLQVFSKEDLAIEAWALYGAP